MTRFLISLLTTTAVATTAVAAPAGAPPPKAGKPTAPPIGAIKGTVIFEGEPPERPKLVRDSDPYCVKTDKLAEDVVVTKGKLKDVLVRIANGSGGKHPAPSQPAVIDQRECMYSPRVVGLVVGQKLVVKNSDGTFHNVHGTIAGKLLWNKPHSAQASDLALDPSPTPGPGLSPQGGAVVDVVCDVHPWMKAYAVVTDHPFFAVTGEDGSFEIKGLASGTYTLEAWHPTLGPKSMTVKIGAGAKATAPARFSYKSN